jgi:hypothetical protein
MLCEAVVPAPSSLAGSDVPSSLTAASISWLKDAAKAVPPSGKKVVSSTAMQSMDAMSLFVRELRVAFFLRFMMSLSCTSEILSIS